MKEDLDRQKNLKLEVAAYFGKPRTFFDCLSMPGSEGHGRVYHFIKRLYSQVENLRVVNVQSNASDQRKPAGGINSSPQTRKKNESNN